MTDALTLPRQAVARVPTDAGEFQLALYANNHDSKEHLALVMGDPTAKRNFLVRIHSECFTGDVLGSRRCDCGPQLNLAMALIAEAGAGMIIYDTVDANLLLGHQADERDYTAAALILRDWNVASIRLMTNNPAKIDSLRALGVDVSARVPLQVAENTDNAHYLRTKAARMRHLLDLG